MSLRSNQPEPGNKAKQPMPIPGQSSTSNPEQQGQSTVRQGRIVPGSADRSCDIYPEATTRRRAERSGTRESNICNADNAKAAKPRSVLVAIYECTHSENFPPCTQRR